jgi:hypothetical protein
MPRDPRGDDRGGDLGTDLWPARRRPRTHPAALAVEFGTRWRRARGSGDDSPFRIPNRERGLQVGARRRGGLRVRRTMQVRGDLAVPKGLRAALQRGLRTMRRHGSAMAYGDPFASEKSHRKSPVRSPVGVTESNPADSCCVYLRTAGTSCCGGPSAHHSLYS